MLLRIVTSGSLGLLACLAAQADTLNGALINAYQNNPQLNSQRAVVRQTDEQVPQALSGYKPTVTATASTAQQYTSTVAKVPPTATHPGPDYPRLGVGSSPSALNLTVTQNVFNGFQTANRVRQAESNTSAARETLRV